ncbi:MAG TPA: histidine kinase [Chitinophagaceae bacterium]|nr:histidine kinase [Chitinophagaceae bacterium]
MYEYKDHILLFICIGGIFLAAVYHTILYFHRREDLLKHYAFYLWVLLFYLYFRADLYLDFTGFNFKENRYNWDEVLQMFSFMFYVRFVGYALFLKRSDNRLSWYFWQSAIPVVGVYIALQFIIGSHDSTIDFILRFTIRAYLLVFGLVALILLLRRRNNLYYYYLSAAAITMIFFGVVSSVAMMEQARIFGWGPFYWLLISFFCDVIFFSAALGYLIRQEHQEREQSLKQLLIKEAELQQKELEKMKAVYETREEERMRIARDLHDDMGSTLSSIGIYSKVVATYMDSDKQKADEYLEKIQDHTKQLMDTTADMIWSLQSNYGRTESIFKRMQQTAVQLLSSANIVPHIAMRPHDQLPALSIAAQKNIWLIFKEALNNACKYSRATNCSITIEVNNDTLSMLIEDDGVGISEHGNNNGNGLRNMRLRAEELGGKFIMQSNKGNGTLIKTDFPVRNISIPV